MVAVTVPVLVPVAGERVSQVALSPAVHVRVPLPVFEIVNDWVAGFVPPAVPAKLRLVRLMPMIGVDEGAAATVRDTGIACGVFVAPLAAMLITAE